MINNKTLQARFNGYLNTPNLWNNNAVYGLHQLLLNDSPIKIDKEIDEKQRLGKYVENFVFHQIEKQNNASLIAKNIQIQKEKQTIGELDCLLQLNSKPIHLEIVYKFYLYVETLGEDEIERFIGPNKKDSLVEKLNKLKEKQLPLLYSNECESYLTEFDLKATEFNQFVLFKAQIFLPYINQKATFSKLNNDCKTGIYINKKELVKFKDCKFFKPLKKDWLLKPHCNVSWKTYNDIRPQLKEYLREEYSPMLWIKNKNGVIDKVFLVWW